MQVKDRIKEVRILGKNIHIVLEPDVFHLPESIPAVQTDPKRIDQGIQIEGYIDDEEGSDKYERPDLSCSQSFFSIHLHSF